MSYTNWALYHESTETVEWKPVSEHIRHLGNTQSADGSHSEMVNQMTKDMRTATRALQRKVIKTLGAQQIANIVLAPKMKYQMVLSNTNACVDLELDRDAIRSAFAPHGVCA